MIDYKLHNSPGYSTRVCPTAVVLFEHQHELCTILIQNTSSHRGWILPNGKLEDTDDNNQAGAAREFDEETGISKLLLEHVSSLGTLHRAAGTKPKPENTFEDFRLRSKPEGKKYFFLKKQLYECFIMRNINIEDLEYMINDNDKNIDSLAVTMVPLSEACTKVGIESDRTVLNYIAQDYDDILSYLNTGKLWDMSAIHAQLLLHKDKIFDK